MRHITAIVVAILTVLSGCTSTSSLEERPDMMIARLGRPGGDEGGFDALRQSFRTKNPGYDVSWHERLDRLAAVSTGRLIFVQSETGRGDVASEARSMTGREFDGAVSDLTRGDIVVLRPDETFRAEPPVAALVFDIPDPVPDGLPAFIRPDWDPGITDTPGGCAEDQDAYRRILVTWLREKGPYTWHAINCHRVRITDSFCHYHPADGGFDEFYFVQGVAPGAAILTSDRVDRIESGDVTEAEIDGLIDRTELAVGDLVYLPRTVAHRGLGGVLTQVITVPGFKPGAEIGVDHHIHAINERLALSDDRALPCHRAAAARIVVK